MAALLALEPGTQSGGMYAYKPGYHNTRGNLLAEPEWRNDYSIRDEEDKQGPADKCAAYDWTFPEAHAGNYGRIRLYTDRLQAAWERDDPRVSGWREALGQSDSDLLAEGYDFRYHRERTPDSSHLWHIHLSEDRGMVESWHNKQAMLSVLSGQSLEDWLAGGGSAPGPIGDDMLPDERAALGEVLLILTQGKRGNAPQLIDPAANQTVAGRPISWLPGQQHDRAAAETAMAAQLSAMTVMLAAMAEILNDLASGGGSVDTAVIIARMNELAAEADADRTAMQTTIDQLTAELTEANQELDRIKAAMQAGEAAQAQAVADAFNEG